MIKTAPLIEHDMRLLSQELNYAYEHRFKNIDHSIRIARKVLESATVCKHSNGIVGSNALLGLLLGLKGDMQGSIDHTSLALSLNTEEQNVHVARAYYSYGIVARRIAETDTAIMCFIKASNIFLRIQDCNGYVLSLNALAYQYYEAKKFNMAKTILNDCLSIVDEVDNQHIMSSTYFHYARTLFALGNDAGSDYLYQAESMKLKIKDYSGLTAVYHMQAKRAVEESNGKSAENLFGKCMEMAIMSNDPYVKARAQQALSNYARIDGRIFDSEELIVKAIDICKSNEILELLPRFYADYVEILEIKKDFRTALKIEKRRNLAANKVHKQNMSTLVGLSRVLISLTEEKKKRKTLEVQNQRLESLLRTNQFLLNELHHRVKNNLQVILSIIKNVLQDVEDGIIEAGTACGSISNRIDNIVLAHNQMTTVRNATDFNVSKFISDIICQSKNNSKSICSIDYRLEGGFDLPSLDMCIPVGLIVSEAVVNSLEHAFKSEVQAENKVEIILTKSETKRIIRVIDNGVGFNQSMQEIREFGGIGLMTCLSEQLDGIMDISANNGTEIKIIF